MDGLDELINEVAVKEQGNEGQQGNPEGATPADDKTKVDTPPASEAKPNTPDTSGKTAATPAPTVTPKEILGLEDGVTWEQVKKGLDEGVNLKAELETEKKRPTVAFANDKIAAFNRFVELKKIDDFNVFERVNTVNLEDPLQVLVTNFILEHPKYVGQEEKLLKKFAEDYKIDKEAYPNEDVELNKLRLDTDAEKVKPVITGLRESLKTAPSAAAPVDVAARTTAWEQVVTSEIGGFEKISIPTMNPETKKPEGFIDFEVPKEVLNSYIKEASQAYAKISDANDPKAKERVKQEFFKNFIFNKLPDIMHATITKVKTETRKEVEAEYDGAKKLTDTNKDAPPGSAEKDAYEKIWD